MVFAFEAEIFRSPRALRVEWSGRGPGGASRWAGPCPGARPPGAGKGVYPLDHFGECKRVMRKYLRCLEKHGDDAGRCRDVSKKYLECRMERELMAKQPLEELGFAEGGAKQAEVRPRPKPEHEKTRSEDAKEKGFIGGVKSAKAFTESRTGE